MTPLTIINQTFNNIDVQFSEAINPATFTPAQVAIDGPGGPVSISGVSELTADMYQVSFPALSERGIYSTTIGPGIADPSGNVMAQAYDTSLEYASASVVFTSNTTINEEDTSYDGQDIVIDGATVTIDGAHSFDSVQLIGGAVLTHDPNTATQTHELDLSVTNEVIVDSTSRIDVTAKGYLPGRTTGNQPGASSAGGSYGGLGGVRFGATNPVYGDYADPDDWGSGGTGYNTGAAGGGLVQISAGSMTLDGDLWANGGTDSNFGTGSGGGIDLAVSTLSGSGTIEANGGATATGFTYGGGGGRIAVYASDMSGFNAANIIAWGATGGGAGTVYLRDPSQAQGTLVISSGNGGAGGTPLGLPDQPTATPQDPVIIEGSGASAGSAYPGQLLDFEGPVTVTDGGHISVSGNLLFGAASSVTCNDGSQIEADGTLTANVPLEIDNGFLTGGQVVAQSLTLNNSVFTGTGIQAQSLQVLNGSVLTVPAPNAGQPYSLQLTVSGELDVDAASRIDVTAKGYLPGRTTGNQPGANGAGGSYGGLGGVRFGATNPVYGDYADPDDWGSGGTGYNTGAAGGGLVQIGAGTMTLDGDLWANGGTDSNFGTGSGGGIDLAVSTLSGSGTIEANGGATASGWTYGGGGGRIAVYASDMSGFNAANIIAWGATGGGAGTVYLRDPSQAQGTLLISSGNGGAGGTPLGLPDQPTATPQDPVIIEGSGASAGSAYPGQLLDFEGPVTVTDGGHISVSGNLLFGAASSVTCNDGSQIEADGTLTANVPLEIDNGFLTGGQVVAQSLTLNNSVFTGTGIQAQSLQVLNGSVLTVPAPNAGQPYSLQLTVSGELDVDAASRIDVTAKGYLPGRTTGNQPGASSAGGSYGGLGGVRFGATNPVYGDYADPDDWGSGGTGYNTGAAGGGLVQISAGSMTLDGDLWANGGTDSNFGTGSGGGIDLAVTTLSGSGTIEANGGATASGWTYGGGGGRIAVYASDMSGFNAANIIAWGATGGGAGTVYLRDPSQAQGTLVISSGNGGAGGTPLGLPDQPTATPQDPVIIEGSGASAGSAYPGQLLDFEGPVTVTDGGHISVSGNLLFGAASSVTCNDGSQIEADGTLTANVPLEIDNGFLTGGQVVAQSLTLNNSVFTGTGIQAQSLQVLNGSVLTVPAPNAGQPYSLQLTVSGELDVDAASRIDVTAKGYLPGRTTGNQPGAHSAGGSYGGLGGVRFGATNPVYGDYADPDDWGSGGVGYNTGAAGGGLVQISAGTMTLDGDLWANGGTDSNFGTGSGGGIDLAVTTLSGSGSIEADGGATATGFTYGGGGGRIAVYASDMSGFNLRSIEAWGATGGGAGTVYIRDPAECKVRSIISNATYGGGSTPLGLPGDTQVVFDDAVEIDGATTGVTAASPGMDFEFESALSILNSAEMQLPADVSFGPDLAFQLDTGASLTIGGSLIADAPITVAAGSLAAASVVAPDLTVDGGQVTTGAINATNLELENSRRDHITGTDAAENRRQRSLDRRDEQDRRQRQGLRAGRDPGRHHGRRRHRK